jgi:hypothetical protein
MVRKQLYLDEAQDAFLRTEATRRGVTQADVVRAAIDALRTKTRSDSRSAAWEDLQSLWSRNTAAGGGRPYRFRRDDAYEDEHGRG